MLFWTTRLFGTLAYIFALEKYVLKLWQYVNVMHDYKCNFQRSISKYSYFEFKKLVRTFPFQFSYSKCFVDTIILIFFVFFAISLVHGNRLLLFDLVGHCHSQNDAMPNFLSDSKSRAFNWCTFLFQNSFRYLAKTLQMSDLHIY